MDFIDKENKKRIDNYIKNLKFNMKGVRKLMGISQEKFGKLIGVSQQTVSNWENPEVKKYPPLEIILYINLHSKATLDDFFKTKLKFHDSSDKKEN